MVTTVRGACGTAEAGTCATYDVQCEAPLVRAARGEAARVARTYSTPRPRGVRVSLGTDSKTAPTWPSSGWSLRSYLHAGTRDVSVEAFRMPWCAHVVHGMRTHVHA